MIQLHCSHCHALVHTPDGAPVLCGCGHYAGLAPSLCGCDRCLPDGDWPSKEAFERSLVRLRLAMEGTHHA